jgi:hypothetical protein
LQGSAQAGQPRPPTTSGARHSQGNFFLNDLMHLIHLKKMQ